MTSTFHSFNYQGLSLEDIVIISSDKDRNRQLAKLLKELFPECKVTVASRESSKLGKSIKRGERHIENDERKY